MEVAENPNYKKKITIGRWTLKYMRLSFLWPSKDKELANDGIHYYIGWILFTSLLIGGNQAHLIRNLIIGRDFGFLEDFCFIIIIADNYFITFNYVYKHHSLAMLLADLSDFRRFGKPEGIERKKRIHDILANLSFHYVVVGAFVYRFTKYHETNRCKQLSAEFGYVDEVCGLILNCWFPYIEYVNRYSILYLLLLSYQMVSALVFMKSALCTCYHMYEVVHFIIWRIDHLKIKILECFDERNPEKRDYLLEEVIRYHWQILDFSKRINESFQGVMFSHITFTAAVCGCIEYQLIKTGDVFSNGAHLCGFVIAIYLSCLAGQDFINAHESIADAIYNSNWYESDVVFQKKVLFFLMRSQEIQCVRAGPFGILCFPLFVSVLKLSYSILTLLNK